MPKETCSLRLARIFFCYVFAFLTAPLICVISVFSRLYDKFTFEWFQQRHVTTPQEHRRRVARIQDQIKQWHADGRRSRMCTAKPLWNSWNVHGVDKRDLAQIDVSQLTGIVEIDEVNRVLTVEPGMMMGQLTSILIPRGWTIPVVPEFETLTVGGTICGTGVESNSTRWGLSGDSCLGYEVVLSNGSVVNCSKDENSDLFHSIPWSHGTLGFLTAAKIPLIPAEKYVQLEYHCVDSIAQAQQLLESQDHEFVEGMAFARDKFVVMHGNMSDRDGNKNNSRRVGTVNHINRWYKVFFYKHVENVYNRHRRRGQKKGEAKPNFVEFIPLRDYYHRHTRGYFWTFPIVFPYYNNPLFLFLFGWVLPGNAKLYRRLLLSIISRRMYNRVIDIPNNVLQDFIVPLKHLRPLFELSDDLVGIYPLWLCPSKCFKKPGMVHCSNGDSDPNTELYIDVGIYGEVESSKKAEFHSEDTIRKFEGFCIENGGVQFMYADTFLSRDEFHRMFDMSLYDAMRTKYGCQDAFPHVYDKVSKHARGIQV